jgi:hypothetical protein
MQQALRGKILSLVVEDNDGRSTRMLIDVAEYVRSLCPFVRPNMFFRSWFEPPIAFKVRRL